MATVREKGYAHWDGKLVEGRSPWRPIALTHIRLAFRKKNFKLAFSLAFIPAVVFLVGIYVAERMEDFKSMLKGGETFIKVAPSYFSAYYNKGPLPFLLIMILAFGCAGLVADDLKHKALQLYFSRPLSRKDYILGKGAVVAFFVLLYTLVPGIVFLIMKVLFSGSFKIFSEHPMLILSVVGESVLLTVFFVFFTLLLSSISRNSRYAAIMLFAVYLVSDILFGIAMGIFRSPYCALLSLKANLSQAGAAIFGQKLPFAFPAVLSFLVLGGICVLSAFVLQKKIRGVETIR